MSRFVCPSGCYSSVELAHTLYSVSVSIGEEEFKKGGAGFTSQLWKARVSIMKANDVLLNVSDI